MSRILSRRGIVLGGMGAALAGPRLLGSASAAGDAVPVNIANTSGATNLIMASLMKQQKFLESFGLAPTVLQVADGSKILGGIVSGSIDVSMMSGFGQIFPAIERGATLKVLAGGALPPTLALYTAKPAVQSLKDLEGKTIGTGSIGALVYQLTVVLLQKYNVDISKIQFVNIGSSADVFRAVSAGTVDAGTGEASMIEEADKYHVRLVANGNMTLELPEYTYQGAWTSDKMIATKRDTIVKTLAAYAKLYRFAQDPNSKDAFMKAQLDAFKSGPDATSEDNWNFVQKYKPFDSDLVLAPERLTYMQNLNVGFKTQTKILPFNQVADMSLATDAIKLLG